MSIQGLHPDDMVIVPRFKRSNKPRDRHQERRKEERQKQEVRRTRQRQRLSRLRRRQAGGKGARNRFGKGQRVKVSKGSGVGSKLRKAKMASKGASRAIPIIGWAMLIVDLVMLGHEYGRRIEGKSARLVEAEDAHAMWGEMSYDVQNNQEVRDFFESDAGMLKAMGQEKKMNSSMSTLKAVMLEENKKRIIGADMIKRDPYFDSPDSLLDKAIAMFRKDEIPGLTDETVRKLKANGYGNTKGGR